MIYFAPGVTEDRPIILHENRLIGGVAAIGAGAPAAGVAANALTETTYDTVRGGDPTTYIQVTFPAPVEVDTFAVIGHNLPAVNGSILFGYKATPADPGWTWLNAPAGATPTDGSPIVLLTATVSARVFIVHTRVPPTTAGMALACFWAGKRLALPAWVTPDYVRGPDAVTVEGAAAISRGGQYLGATMRRRGGQLAPQFSPIDRAWADTNLPPFRDHYNARRPFIFAAAPAHHPADVVYGWRGDGAAELRPGLIGGGQAVRLGMELDFHVA